jgi:hypothetical protein
MAEYTPITGSMSEDQKLIALRTLNALNVLSAAGTTGDAIKNIPLALDAASSQYAPYIIDDYALRTSDFRTPTGLLFSYSGQQSAGFDVLTNGGCFRKASDNNTTNTTISAQSVNDGQRPPLLYGFQVTNTASTDRFIKFYANNTFNAGTEILSFCIHQGQSYSYTPMAPVVFNNYLSFNFSTAYATNVAVNANDLFININWALASF